MSELWTVFSREETDVQYSPPLWAKRPDQDDLLPQHIEMTNSRSEIYREQIGSGLSTLKYGRGELAGEIDVLRPKSLPAGAPTIIYIHGGWWQWFCKEQFSFLAEPFNKSGMAVYMPGYKLADQWEPGTAITQIARQMESALSVMLMEAFANRSSGVYIVGHSAGGHLAALLQMVDFDSYGIPVEARRLLKGIFSIAGLFDVRPLVNSFVNDAIEMNMATAASISPYCVDTGLPKAGFPEALCPVHLILPEHDTPEFFRQTKEYQGKLLRAGLDCRVKLAENRDHLDVIERLPEPSDGVFTYIKAQISATSS